MRVQVRRTCPRDFTRGCRSVGLVPATSKSPSNREIESGPPFPQIPDRKSELIDRRPGIEVERINEPQRSLEDGQENAKLSARCRPQPRQIDPLALVVHVSDVGESEELRRPD